MNDRDPWLPLATLHLEGTATPAEEAELAAILEASPEAFEAFREFLVLDRHLRMALDPELSPAAFRRGLEERIRADSTGHDFRRRVIERLKEDVEPPPSRHRLPIIAAMALFSVILLAVVRHRIAAPPPAPPVLETVILGGAAGNESIRDVTITNMRPESTEDNGIAFPETPMLLVADLDEYEARGLLRFDDLRIPSGARVESATLSLTIDSWERHAVLEAFYLRSAWNPVLPETRKSRALGWLHRDLDQPWAEPGAGGPDVHPGRAFTVSAFLGRGKELRTFTLDPTVVQEWVDRPASNQGLLIRSATPRMTVRIHTSEEPRVEYRPQLTIMYVKP